MSDIIATDDEQERLEDFLDDLRSHGRQERTLRAYEYDWRHFAAWYDDTHGQPFTLRDLEPAHVESYLAWCREHEGHKPSTLNRRLTVIKHYAAWAEERNIIDHQRRMAIKHIPMRKRRPRVPHALTPEETDHLLDVVDQRANTRDKAIIYTLVFGGLRVGELVSLWPQDVAFSRGGDATITVREAVAISGLERHIPLPPTASRRLGDYLTQRRRKAPDAAELFVGRQGSLTIERVGAIVRAYANWARLDGVTPHVLRHTFAYTFLADNGQDLVALAEILGHTNLSTTRAYQRLFDS
ncbi:MAG: tyrosine-type recombinase/integrase [Chloroflexi bacterium]|nr:tyrosine-type recombinase/integrase [Chloroflexota bacterium]